MCKAVQAKLELMAKHKELAIKCIKAMNNDDFASAARYIDDGAMLNYKNEQGDTMLHKAAMNWESESIKICGKLVSLGADVNIKDNNGDTPLHYAAGTSDTEKVRLLLEAGANPTVKDNRFQTALHFAAQNDNYDMVRLLILNGANLGESDMNGDTPEDLAEDSTEMYDFMKDCDAEAAKLEKMKLLAKAGDAKSQEENDYEWEY